MKLNESTAVSTSKVLLVTYDRRHVLTYHAWMEDPAIQEATASERLSLAEEYSNQASWRASHDKLTFIVCQPSPSLTPAPSPTTPGAGAVLAGEVDGPDKMIGDVNLFLTPYDEDEDEDEAYCVGEVDIMIADAQHRGQGVGRAAVGAFLAYVSRNLDGILAEYSLSCSLEEGRGGDHDQAKPKLKMLVAKINAGNGKSIALFRSLGFEQEGAVNYFGEVKMVLRADDLRERMSIAPEGYMEVVYRRAEGDDGTGPSL
ncbi:GNAT domain-containing protein [Podospora appendiculata]|uniref:GNAT domain-containing protein n=1 Tax=Podospora appendiculata TaxID=314037 RepID=A0AAE1CAU7_9PEZI|nr:GNAT domain-containing protein [Podospora appendiculata]